MRQGHLHREQKRARDGGNWKLQNPECASIAGAETNDSLAEPFVCYIMATNTSSSTIQETEILLTSAYRTILNVSASIRSVVASEPG